ncbi:hypothetical protein [Planktotalea arctica]|uniref:hypothetical protein n=1 Tax=Planktotalea arctica TaxID=1481893 RepID=UPI00111BEE6B|nr:hypothetical protein [Planktotalea arctica]
MLDVLKRHLFLSLAFVAAFAVAMMFVVRLTLSLLVWSDPAQMDQPIKAWMTPRYVSRSWHVPPETIGDALGITFDGSGRRVTLAELAESQNRGVQTLIDDLEASIALFKARKDD